jgi:hypothetical protein
VGGEIAVPKASVVEDERVYEWVLMSQRTVGRSRTVGLLVSPTFTHVSTRVSLTHPLYQKAGNGTANNMANLSVCYSETC